MTPQPRIAPMLATAGSVVVDTGFAWEMKYDGQRALVIADGSGVRLSSRNGSSITRTYPEVVAGLRAALGGRHAVLDGEIVALDAAGRPSFGLLQRRMHVQRPTAASVREVPAALFLFDVLSLTGEPTIDLPYEGRRGLLEDLGIEEPRVVVPPAWTTADGVDGHAMLELARDHGLEGVVAKRLRSRYRPGERSPDWIKQPLRVVATLIVCGWIGTATHLESLLLGAPHPDGGLRYVGHVSTGFTAAARKSLLAQLVTLEQADSPFDTTPPRPVDNRRWVHPVLVGEVHYREFTGRLRHPSWRGLRPDISAAQAEWPI